MHRIEFYGVCPFIALHSFIHPDYCLVACLSCRADGASPDKNSINTAKNLSKIT